MNSINPYYTCIDISLEQSYVIKFVSASFRKEIPLVEKKNEFKGIWTRFDFKVVWDTSML